MKDEYRYNLKPNFLSEYNRWHREIARRKRETDITLEQYSILIMSPCYFCGANPNQKMHCSSLFLKNGIDRLDNEIDYLFSNVKTACKDCNYAKQELHIDEFLELVDKIHNHQLTRAIEADTFKL